MNYIRLTYMHTLICAQKRAVPLKVISEMLGILFHVEFRFRTVVWLDFEANGLKTVPRVDRVTLCVFKATHSFTHRSSATTLEVRSQGCSKRE